MRPAARLQGNRSVIPGPAPNLRLGPEAAPSPSLPSFFRMPRVVLPSPEVRAEASSLPLGLGEKRLSPGGCGATWGQPSSSSARPLPVPLHPLVTAAELLAAPAWFAHHSACHPTAAPRVPFLSPATPRRLLVQLNPLAAPTRARHLLSAHPPLKPARLLRSPGARPCRGGQPRGRGAGRGGGAGALSWVLRSPALLEPARPRRISERESVLSAEIPGSWSRGEASLQGPGSLQALLWCWGWSAPVSCVISCKAERNYGDGDSFSCDFQRLL